MKTEHFNGLRVGAFESRMANQMESLIRRYGGMPLVAPSMQEIPLDHHPEVETFGQQLIAGQIHSLLLLTGVGTRTMLQILEHQLGQEDLNKALNRISVIVRGPKPAAALREQGLVPTLTVPEPNTWKDILSSLDEHQSIAGQRMAVQEYGVSNSDLLEGLRERGATVISVPIYRWSLPEDTGPLRNLLSEIVKGQVQVLLITNAVQLDHAFEILQKNGQKDQFLEACQKMIMASIGPTASERIRSYGLQVNLEPSHPKMGILVKETSEQTAALLQTKHSS